MPLVRQIFNFQFVALFKTFPLGGRCPRKGADEGKRIAKISPHQSKIKDFCQLLPREKLLRLRR